MIIKYAINKYKNVDICLHVSMFSIFSMHVNQMESLLKHRFLGTTPETLVEQVWVQLENLHF